MKKNANAAVERMEAQLAQLQARLDLARARERKQEQRRQTHANVVAGALLRSNPAAFGLDARALLGILDGLVTRPHDRRALGLATTPTNQPERSDPNADRR